jgi:GNAT superfamily N-acetyltransferase
MAHDPARIVAAFAGVLPIDEPLVVEDERFVAYEYIGDNDHLGESSGAPRRRGSRATSADAAIRYRTPSGTTEVALIEWKYVEDYRGHELSRDKAAIRPARYRRLWDADDAPLHTDVVPYEDLFVEPFYQLMRQQLLAHAMETAHEGGTDVVRVLHVSPAGNNGLRTSLNRASHRAVGDDVFDVWRALLRRPDRFVSLDSRALCSTASAEYRARYDHD